jgi:hypothetical protein
MARPFELLIQALTLARRLSAAYHFSMLAGPRLRIASAQLAVAVAEAAYRRSLSRGDFAPRSGRRRFFIRQPTV